MVGYFYVAVAIPVFRCAAYGLLLLINTNDQTEGFNICWKIVSI